MLKTLKAYKYIYDSKALFWGCLIIFVGGVISSSVFVLNIEKELQDSILSIMSIIFPLIAGFLTFGRDTLRDLKKGIDRIVQKDTQDIGTPTSDTTKRKIKYLKILSDKFIDVVISTFFISFILIIGLLIAKVNKLEFETSSLYFPLKNYVVDNWINLFIKLSFFYLVFVMFLNALFLIIFIVKITRDDELISV
jgi:hypothetical protein